VRYNLRNFLALVLILPPMLLVAACGSEAPVPEPSGIASVPSDPLPVMGPERRILAFGDSLFAGYNLAEGEGYPAKLELALRAQGINARITDGAVSGDTTQAGLARLAFLLDNQPAPPELALVELGGNDLLRGLEPSATKANLGKILAEFQRRKIPVLLIGMRAPPNLGADFLREFDGLYGELAQEYNVKLVPFFLEPIWNKPDLIQPDRIHPTAQGIDELVAATVDDVAGALPNPD
jgi:acyl-CoA thioesterase-1